MCLVLCIAPAYWTFLPDLLHLADCSHLFTTQEERRHVTVSGLVKVTCQTVSFTVGPYRCFLSGFIPRQARHIITPPMTKIAPPIHPTNRAGPKVYLKPHSRDVKHDDFVFYFHLLLGEIFTLEPELLWVHQHFLLRTYRIHRWNMSWTENSARSSWQMLTPQQCHRPLNVTPNHRISTTCIHHNNTTGHCEHKMSAPARRNMIPAVRVIVALMLSSMLPIFRHFSANMAIRQLIAPRTIPTIIRARTAWSRAENQSSTI